MNDIPSISHTCPPSPAPGLQLLLHRLSPSPCQSRQNASSQSSPSPRPANKASSLGRQNLKPLHWRAPGGQYSDVTHRWLHFGCSSGCCTTGRAQCHCSDDRCVRPVHGGTPGHICSGTTRQCSRRPGCRRRVCWYTHRGPRTLCHRA